LNYKFYFFIFKDLETKQQADHNQLLNTVYRQQATIESKFLKSISI